VSAVALGAAAYLTGFLILYTASLYVDVGAPPSPREVWPGFAHVRFLGQWQTWTLPLIVLPTALWPQASPAVRASFVLLAAGWWALLFAAGTRGTYVAEISAFACVTLIFGRAALSWLRLQVLPVVGGLALYITGYVVVAGDRSAFMNMFTHMTSSSTSGRGELWKAAVDAALASPLLGIGPQHYVYVRPADSFAAHPHNAVLQWACEWGVPSAIVMLAIVSWALISWMRARRTEHIGDTGSPGAVLAVALSASLIAGTVHAMLSGIIVMPMSQMQMALIAGWAISVHLGRGAPTVVEERAAIAHLLLVAGVASCLALLLVSAAPEINTRQFDLDTHTETIGPRFWHRGMLSGTD
jgi:O-antigen ligase